MSETNEQLKVIVGRMESALALLSIRLSEHGFEPHETKRFTSDLLATSLVGDAASLYAHYTDAA